MMCKMPETKEISYRFKKRSKSRAGSKKHGEEFIIESERSRTRFLPPEIIQDVNELLQHGNQIVVTQVRKDVFEKDKPFYLRLLSDQNNLDLLVNDLIDQVIATIKLANPSDLFSGVYIYSLQIIQPDGFYQKLKIESSWLSGLEPHLPEVKAGYLYHGVLYSLPTESLVNILNQFLGVAEHIEMSIKLSSKEGRIRKDIHLLTIPQTVP